MATCPEGHESTATDFCDLCGRRIDGTATASGQASLSGAASTAASSTATVAEPAALPAEAKEACPNCDAERTGQFCETCGYNFTSGGTPPAQPEAAQTTGAWSAIVTASRDYYESVVAAGGPEAGTIQFPAYCPQRQFQLTGPEMRIGRRSPSRGLEPEIDLTGPPMDSGVSHMHAVLIEEPDGTWSVLDPGSSNGTQLNGTEIATGVKLPLHDGDTISLGGWTMITIRAS